MKILFLCGVFGEKNTEYIAGRAKRPVEYSADGFQKKLIQGFHENNCDFSVLSAPFVGSYPNASKIFYFTNREQVSPEANYVSFNNVWGIRNFTRARALKSAVNDFVKASDEEKRIIVYSPHTPFLDAAVYAKHCDPNIKVGLIVPDLPQYMNLNAHISLAYRIGKKYDIARFNQLNKEVDFYVLLTEAMKEKIDIHGRPYMVVEGIVDSNMLKKHDEMIRSTTKSENEKYIVYTGKLNEKFGVKDLVDDFLTIEQPEYRLLLCGKGDLEGYIKEKSKRDSRIIYMGQVSPEIASQWVYRADVLVNPRKNDEEYTKYSFPSKNIEYLLTGNPMVGYMLDGMPEQYRKYMVIPGDGGLKAAIQKAMEENRRNDFAEYVEESLLAGKIIKNLLNM